MIMVSNNAHDEDAFLKRLHPDEQKVYSSFAVNNKPVQWLPENFEPGPFDVVISHGKESQHIGNKRFRLHIEDSIDDYTKAQSRQEKSAVISTIIEQVKQNAAATNGGFVCKDRLTHRWFHVRCKVARDKVGNALRDAIKQRFPSESKKRRLDTPPSSNNQFGNDSGLNQSMLMSNHIGFAAAAPSPPPSSSSSASTNSHSNKRSRKSGASSSFAVETTSFLNRPQFVGSSVGNSMPTPASNNNININNLSNSSNGNININNSISGSSFSDLMAFGNNSTGSLDFAMSADYLTSAPSATATAATSTINKQKPHHTLKADIINDLQALFEIGGPSNVLPQPFSAAHNPSAASLYPSLEPRAFPPVSNNNNTAAASANIPTLADPFSTFDSNITPSNEQMNQFVTRQRMDAFMNNNSNSNNNKNSNINYHNNNTLSTTAAMSNPYATSTQQNQLGASSATSRLMNQLAEQQNQYQQQSTMFNNQLNNQLNNMAAAVQQQRYQQSYGGNNNINTISNVNDTFNAAAVANMLGNQNNNNNNNSSNMLSSNDMAFFGVSNTNSNNNNNHHSHSSDNSAN